MLDSCDPLSGTGEAILGRPMIFVLLFFLFGVGFFGLISPIFGLPILLQSILLYNKVLTLKTWYFSYKWSISLCIFHSLCPCHFWHTEGSALHKTICCSYLNFCGHTLITCMPDPWFRAWSWMEHQCRWRTSRMRVWASHGWLLIDYEETWMYMRSKSLTSGTMSGYEGRTLVEWV